MLASKAAETTTSIVGLAAPASNAAVAPKINPWSQRPGFVDAEATGSAAQKTNPNVNPICAMLRDGKLAETVAKELNH